MDWLNANGLVNGDIPARTECSFWNLCTIRAENCPSEENENLREHPFSCACARAISLSKSSREEAHG